MRDPTLSSSLWSSTCLSSFRPSAIFSPQRPMEESKWRSDRNMKFFPFWPQRDSWECNLLFVQRSHSEIVLVCRQFLPWSLYKQLIKFMINCFFSFLAGLLKAFQSTVLFCQRNWNRPLVLKPCQMESATSLVQRYTETQSQIVPLVFSFIRTWTVMGCGSGNRKKLLAKKKKKNNLLNSSNQCWLQQENWTRLKGAFCHIHRITVTHITNTCTVCNWSYETNYSVSAIDILSKILLHFIFFSLYWSDSQWPFHISLFSTNPPPFFFFY